MDIVRVSATELFAYTHVYIGISRKYSKPIFGSQERY